MLKDLFADLATWDGPAAGRSVASSSNGGPERVHTTNLGEGDDKPRRWWRP
jgi:hypothetical protein